ncbi:MAG: protein-disulfide isomerase [Candidatus Woesearchaeota archaeon]|jgi:protein-disulfide isomerase
MVVKKAKKKDVPSSSTFGRIKSEKNASLIVAAVIVTALVIIMGILYHAVVSTDSRNIASKDAITVIEYGDFECRFCALAQNSLKEVHKLFGAEVYFEYRHFPLGTQHPYAFDAAIASECARTQGKFWEYHDVLYANNLALTRTDLIVYATDTGLNVNKFVSCLDERKTEPAVREDISSARDAGATSIPTFIIGETKLSGVQSVDVLIDTINKEILKNQERRQE